LLTYDKDTGIFRWKIKPARNIVIGSEAGSFNTAGYRRIRIDGEEILAHRIAWAMDKGAWPKEEIDHKNQEPSDNRIDNLQEATRVQNACNRKAQRNNKSGFKGVRLACLKKDGTQSWDVSITINGKLTQVYGFKSAEEAHEHYKILAVQFHDPAFVNFG